MGLSVERLYRCPVCEARIPIDADADADLLVLLQGEGRHVEHVVTIDDVEVHRCRLQDADVSLI